MRASSPTNQTTRKTRRSSRQESLKKLVRERIEKRLGHRIRGLAVAVEGRVIRLAGQCSTYYSKQLAQHAVLGVVENEIIDNRIEIAVPPPRD